jgi:hypothetical protein
MMKYILNLRKDLEHKHILIDDDTYPLLTTENIRKEFEEALELWGLDFNLSHKIWDLYLNFEKSNYEKFSKAKDESNSKDSIYLIRGIYRRRLSFPHMDLDIMWSEYKKWEKDEEEKQKVQKKYEEVR